MSAARTSLPSGLAWRFVLRRQVGRWTWIVTPLALDRDSTRSSPTSGRGRGTAACPVEDHWADEQGDLIEKLVVSSSERIRSPLRCTLSFPAALGFQLADSGRETTERTVVFAHRASVSVVDATSLGRVFNAVQNGVGARI
jgi:hypothetical protein